jgi:uroporphyrinogen-III decarboxylase
MDGEIEENQPMPDYQDLVTYIKGPLQEKPLVAIWARPPNTAGVVGGIPDMIRYYFDVEERVRLEKELKDLLPQALILPGFWPSLGVVVEASAFGGRMVWSRKGAPHIFPAFRSIQEVDSLRMPKPGEAGLTPLFMSQLEVMRRLLQRQGLDADPLIKSMGPAEVCGLLLGYENYFLSLYDEGKRLKTLMEVVTEFIIQWLHLQEEAIGEPLLLQIAEHVPHQVNAEHLKEFILPHLRAIYAEFPGQVKIYHNEGLHSPEHIQWVLRFGADVWHFGSDAHNLSDLYARIGDALVPFGGVNPHGPIRHGTPEQVKEETRAVLRAARGRKLLLSTGTGTTPETTLENVRAMVETALG